MKHTQHVKPRSKFLQGIAVCVLVLGMCLGHSAQAHPHVFVQAKTGFILSESNGLKALRISWTYDAFTSLVLFETLALDEDNDGLLNEADHARIIQGETDWDPEYKGDIYLEIAGQDYPLGRPEAAAVTYEGDQIEVSFELPLLTPTETLDAVVLRLYDPAFYYAYSISPTLEGPALPSDCNVDVMPFKPSGAQSALQEKLAALSREETPEQSDVGRLFSDKVHLTCG